MQPATVCKEVEVLSYYDDDAGGDGACNRWQPKVGQSVTGGAHRRRSIAGVATGSARALRTNTDCTWQRTEPDAVHAQPATVGEHRAW